MAMRTLIVDGSPEPSSPELVAWYAQDMDYVVAVDRGAAVCRAAGVVPDLFVGDEDSIDAATAAWVHDRANRIVRLEVEKDDTDLGAAIACAWEEAQRRGELLDLMVTCATGGRPDHMLAIYGLLARYKRNGPVLIEDDYEMTILSPEGIDSWELAEDEVGKTVSVIALEPGTNVSEWGMRWDLDGFDLPPFSDLGVSNRVVDPDAGVSCHEGCAAVFLFRQANPPALA